MGPIDIDAKYHRQRYATILWQYERSRNVDGAISESEGIADAFGDPPFGLLHHLSSVAFSIFVSWIIGRCNTALRSRSAMRRLLFFTADLLLSFRAQHIGTKGKILTEDQKGLFKACNEAECKSMASVPEVASNGIAMPDPPEAVVDISVGNVWITGCTTVSIIYGKSLNMPSSLLSCVSLACTDINSSSVSTSDSACAMSSPCTSPVVLGASSSSVLSNNEVNLVDLR
ncbi:hypothetical protein H5410_000841 [Solanum commersonii]|uniref:Uncharacterized protein n=1 Tax=Solanum commersonii TaxID=4109 RepID=A0A9J6AXD5_SOLCO|nr:hypothetical protein H5410_000841 [Solanum commersonii]